MLGNCELLSKLEMEKKDYSAPNRAISEELMTKGRFYNRVHQACITLGIATEGEAAEQFATRVRAANAFALQKHPVLLWFPCCGHNVRT
jgi:hypothetical protein